VEKLLKPYIDYSINDYQIKLNDKIYPSFVTLFDKEERINGKILNEKIINKLNPNRINSQLFWYNLQKYFKFSPICGKPSFSIEEVNYNNFNLPKYFGIIDDLNHIKKDKINFLEIGYGYGNMFNWVNNNSNFNYCGIDLLKRINGKGLYETNGWEIPNEIKNLNVVYSINVFQHLSFKQRLNYFEKIYKILNKNGVFYCSLFIYDELNFNKKFWDFIDENGNVYCNLFGQLTEVDKKEELFNILKLIGYKIEFKNFYPNILFLKLTK